jgi:uncharacterized protein (TIGR03437 family)
MRMRSLHSSVLLACVASAWIAICGAQGAALPRKLPTLPLSFEENTGQAPKKFQYVAHGAQYQMWIGSAENRLVWSDSPSSEISSVRTRFFGADRNARVRGAALQTAQTNYFIGHSVSEWHTGVRNYGEVRVDGIYPGVDLVYHASQGDLEYDFQVNAGSDPSAIQFEVKGAAGLRIDSEGDLVLGSGLNQVRWKKPAIYQDTIDGRKPVEGAYELKGRRVRFRIGSYDRERRLIIDPVLKYASYFGAPRGVYNASIGSVGVRAIGTDGAGNVYIAGIVNTDQLPVTKGVVQTAYAGGSGAEVLFGDAFVAKFSPVGAILWVTYLGGSHDDMASSLAVDSSGNVYVAGITDSADFPVTSGVLQPVYGGAGGNLCKAFGDAFVAKLNSTGTQLLYSTYLGGSQDDGAAGVTVDAAGNAYVAGSTLSTNFPTQAPLQSSMHGLGGEPTTPDCNGYPLAFGDVFVAKLNPTATALVFSTYLGGSLDDAATTIAIDSSSNVYVAGATLSTDFPVTPGAFQKANRGTDAQNFFQHSGDGFVAKLNSSGSALVYATYIGGRGDDAIASIFVDKAGTAYLTGATSSPDFPVTKNALQPQYSGYISLPTNVLNNYGDAFVTRLNQTGTGLLYSTFLGGMANDEGEAITVDPSGLVYVAGVTDSSDFPVTNKAVQPTFGGDETSIEIDYRPFGDGFLAVVDPASGSLLYSTFYGGTLDDGFMALALDGNGNVWLTGGTDSTDLHVTSNASQALYPGVPGVSGDGMLAEFSPAGTNPPAVGALENAASNATNVVSPGMIFVLYGQNLGPSNLLNGAADPVSGLLSGTLAQVSVLFNNIPSPLVYVVNKQVAGTVPYELAGQTTAQVVVEVSGVRSAPFTVQVAPSAPGLFSVDFSGNGPAVVYNANNTLNSSSNPASRGSIIQIFGTGEGQTNPAGEDGLFSIGLPPKPLLPVSVTIGDVPQTQFAYVGGVPGEPPGVLQVNVTIAAGTPKGNQPIVLQVGGANSQPNLTVAIQ